jgi:hypothetical protein
MGLIAMSSVICSGSSRLGYSNASVESILDDRLVGTKWSEQFLPD